MRAKGHSGREGAKLRVFVATQSVNLSEALCVYLAEHLIDVTVVVSDVSHMLARVADERPDAVIIDWHLGASVSTQAVADLQILAGTPAIILSSSCDCASARCAGAAAVATLGDAPDDLLAALHGIAGAAA